MRAVGDSSTAPYGGCATRRSIVAQLSLSLAWTAPAPSIASFESRRSVRASRLPPLGLVSDTACPPQLKGCCSTGRRSVARN